MEAKSQFLTDLQLLCQAIARGDYDGLDHLFALTGAPEVPSDIRDLANLSAAWSCRSRRANFISARC